MVPDGRRARSADGRSHVLFTPYCDKGYLDVEYALPPRPAGSSVSRGCECERSFDHPERADERLLELLDTLHSEHARSAFELLWVTSASEKALARHVTEVLETVQPDLLASFTKRFATFDDPGQSHTTTLL